MTNGPPTGDRRLPGGSAKPRREPEEIGTIIARWLRKNRVEERVNEDGIYGYWKQVVGEEIAGQTRVVKWVGGVLTVEVASAPLLLELSGYYREGILESIRAQPEFRGIRDIRFRAGTVPEPPVSSPRPRCLPPPPPPEGAIEGAFEESRKERRIGRESEKHGEA